MNKTTQLLWGWCHKPWNKDPYETPMDILDIIILLGKEIILNPRNGGRWKMILYLPFQYYWFFSIRMLIFRVVKPFPKKKSEKQKKPSENSERASTILDDALLALCGTSETCFWHPTSLTLKIRGYPWYPLMIRSFTIPNQKKLQRK